MQTLLLPVESLGLMFRFSPLGGSLWVALVALGRLPVEPSQILGLIWIHVLRTYLYSHPDVDTFLMH